MPPDDGSPGPRPVCGDIDRCVNTVIYARQSRFQTSES